MIISAMNNYGLSFLTEMPGDELGSVAIPTCQQDCFELLEPCEWIAACCAYSCVLLLRRAVERRAATMKQIDMT